MWLALAEPARWVATERGIVLTESAATGQFQVVAVFVLVGTVWGLIGGIGTQMWVARRGPDLGWVVVPLVAVGGLVAALVAWRLGVAFGPPDPATVRSIDLGDTVPERLALDTPTVFLAWALAAVFGAGATAFIQAPVFSERSEPPAPA